MRGLADPTVEPPSECVWDRNRRIADGLRRDFPQAVGPDGRLDLHILATLMEWTEGPVALHGYLFDADLESEEEHRRHLEHAQSECRSIE